MREEVGLALRQEFVEAVDAVELQVEIDRKSIVSTSPNFPPAVMEKFHATEAQLKAMAARCQGLTVAGVEDKKGYAVVHDSRMELADARILIDKTRKAENDEAQQHIKMCNNVAKYLVSLIEPTETALKAEEKRIDAELDAIKAKKQAEAAAALQKRIEELQAFGQPFTLAELTLMTDTQYGFLRATAEDAFKAREALRIEAEAALAKVKAEEAAKAEAARLAKEEAERIERERVAAQAAENAKAAAALEAERAAMRKEREEFEAAKRASEQAERERIAREEGAAKAKAEAERIAAEERDRKEREAVAEKTRQEAEAKRLAEIQAARPDAEKIRALAQVVRGVAFPKMATIPGNAAMTEIESAVTRLAAFIEKKADTLAPITTSP